MADPNFEPGCHKNVNAQLYDMCQNEAILKDRMTQFEHTWEPWFSHFLRQGFNDSLMHMSST